MLIITCTPIQIQAADPEGVAWTGTPCIADRLEVHRCFCQGAAQGCGPRGAMGADPLGSAPQNETCLLQHHAALQNKPAHQGSTDHPPQTGQHSSSPGPHPLCLHLLAQHRGRQQPPQVEPVPLHVTEGKALVVLQERKKGSLRPWAWVEETGRGVYCLPGRAGMVGWTGQAGRDSWGDE